MSPTTLNGIETVGDLLRRLGNISPDRIRFAPRPGSATEKDLLKLLRQKSHLCELVDGTLVEKIIGFLESHVACQIIKLLGAFLDDHDLGITTGMDGAVRLMPGLVRIPDVSFIRWEKLPGRKLPSKPIPDLVPDLAVEVISRGNTEEEMERKLGEYFLVGVQVVWLVRPTTRTVTVHTSVERFSTFTEADTLDGGDVLPGLSLSVKRLFEKLPARRSRKRS